MQVAERSSGRVRLVAPAVAALVAVVGFAAAQPERDAATPDAAGHFDPEPYTLRRAPGALECVGADGSIVMRIGLDDREFSFGYRAVVTPTARGALVLVGAPAADVGHPRAGRVDAFGSWRSSPEPLWSIEGGAPQGLFGGALAIVPDVNGDGAPEFLIGAPGAGGATLISGADRSRLRTYSGDRAERFGVEVAVLPDMNGDGLPEHAVDSWFRDEFGNLRARRHVFDGATGEPAPEALEATRIVRLAGDLDWNGEVDSDDLARLLRAVGRVTPRGDLPDPGADLNGDGVVDRADLDLLLANLGASGPARVGDPATSSSSPCVICPNGECYDPIFNNCDETGGGDPGPDGDGGGVGGKDGTVAGGGGSAGGGGGGSGDGDGGDGGETDCSVMISNPPRAIGVWTPNDADDDDTNDTDDLPRLTASGSDPNGTYTWQIVQSGPDAGAVAFMDPATGQPTPAPTGPTIYLMGTGASAALNDVSVEVTHTTADGSCSETDMVELTVIAVAWSIRTAGLWSAANGVSADLFTTLGAPVLGVITEDNPAGALGFFKNVEIQAEITPCVADLDLDFDVKRHRQGFAGVLSADVNGQVALSPLPSVHCPPPMLCDDDTPVSDGDPSSTNLDEDLALDVTENCVLFSVDMPGIATHGATPATFMEGVQDPNRTFVGLVNAMVFKEWLQIDGFRASNGFIWHAATEIAWVEEEWGMVTLRFGNALGAGPMPVGGQQRALNDRAPLAPTLWRGVLPAWVVEPESIPPENGLEIDGAGIRELLGEFVNDRDSHIAYRKLLWLAPRLEAEQRLVATEQLIAMLEQPALSAPSEDELFFTYGSLRGKALRILGLLQTGLAMHALASEISMRERQLFRVDSREYFYPAVEALLRVGAPAVPALLDRIDDADEEEWPLIRGTLVRIDRDTAAVLDSARGALRDTRNDLVRDRLKELIEALPRRWSPLPKEAPIPLTAGR